MRLGLGLGLGSGGLPLWTPATLPNKIAWYDPAQNLTRATNRVSAWGDSSGVGDTNRNAVQATSSARPLYTAADSNFNNAPTVKDDDGARYLATGTWGATYTQPFAIFLVGTLVNRLVDGNTAGNRTAILASTDWSYYAGGSVVQSSIANNSTPQCVCAVFNGASSAFYIRDATTANVGGNPGSNALNVLGLLGTSDGQGLGLGDTVAEIVIVSGIPAAADIKNFFRYAGAKYGVTVSGT